MPSSSPLARLWTHAQAAVTALCASLLPLDTLLVGERRRLRAWLRALEAFCRRIALTEALALARDGWRTAIRARPQRKTARKRRPAFRLWPKPRCPSARIRLLGRATSMRELQAEQRRAELAARLAAARARPKPPHLRIADRIEALQRFLDAPRAAIRRFARKLAQAPILALAIVARRAPACPFLSPESVNDGDAMSYAAALNTS